MNKKDVESIALLSRLELSDEDMEKMTHQLAKILDYMKKLDQLDTTDVEPLSHPGANTNVFRQDALAPSLERESALREAPEQSRGFFRVPKVIE